MSPVHDPYNPKANNGRHAQSQDPLLHYLLKHTARWQVPGGSAAGKFNEHSFQHLWGQLEGQSQPAPTIPLSRQDRYPNAKSRPLYRAAMAGAAAVIVLLLLWWAQSPGAQVNIQVARGAQQTVWLPDSSEVQLNADSKLHYNKEQWATQRVVHLSGEALFKVKKGSRFTVQTPQGQVAVLGTVFNVFARPEHFTVQCLSGKVAVKAKGSTGALTLLPAQKATTVQGAPPAGQAIAPALEKQTLANPRQAAAWTRGLYFFEQQPLPQVFAAIERQFNVQIQFQGQTPRTYTGSFTYQPNSPDPTQDLKNALAQVCWPMALDFTIQQNTVYIYTPGT